MNRTKIEYCDYTWNPVTGCLYGCEYCYAIGIAKRFGTGKSVYHETNFAVTRHYNGVIMPDLHEPVKFMELTENGDGSGKPVRINPYPADFTPTFHRYRLDEPQKVKKPQTIFVCSMADLFGDWIPDEWIEIVFNACSNCPQHKFLFLTKNPRRYTELAAKGKLPPSENHWYGVSITKGSCSELGLDISALAQAGCNTYLSIEPICGEVSLDLLPDWVIIGAETGNRAGKVKPEKAWIDRLVDECFNASISIFMKNNVIPSYGNNIVAQLPWDAAEIENGGIAK